jgi:hypothetical protein
MIILLNYFALTAETAAAEEMPVTAPAGVAAGVLLPPPPHAVNWQINAATKSRIIKRDLVFIISSYLLEIH